MQELKTQTRHLTDEQGEPLTFSYTLLTERSIDGLTHYGIGIHSSGGDSVRLPRLGIDRAAVELLLERVAQAALSPHHLHDVVQDWLGQ